MQQTPPGRVSQTHHYDLCFLGWTHSPSHQIIRSSTPADYYMTPRLGVAGKPSISPAAHSFIALIHPMGHHFVSIIHPCGGYCSTYPVPNINASSMVDHHSLSHIHYAPPLPPRALPRRGHGQCRRPRYTRGRMHVPMPLLRRPPAYAVLLYVAPQGKERELMAVLHTDSGTCTTAEVSDVCDTLCSC